MSSSRVVFARLRSLSSLSAPPNTYAAPFGASTALAPVILASGSRICSAFGSATSTSPSSAECADFVDHDMVERSSTLGWPASFLPFMLPCVTHISRAPLVHTQCPHRGTGSSPMVEIGIHVCITDWSSRRDGKSASSPRGAIGSGGSNVGVSAGSASSPFRMPESILAMPFAALAPCAVPFGTRWDIASDSS